MGLLRRDRALHLLAECRGDEVWSVEYCVSRGVPQAWIDELADAYESGFRRDSETLYYQNAPVNHYHGVKDVDLAQRIAADLGLNVISITRSALTPRAIVNAIKAAIEED